ncbi:MAG: response regulator [Fidelibacterota bacterium]|nr:MAG: response regulator [Candidatus Neomarinimicrobiota bacterium]
MDNKIPTILVIDDEEVIRDSCSQILAKEGLCAITAENGMIGLEKVKEVQPDVAIVDLKMPGMNGFELLGEIKELDPELIAIVITGYPNIESAVEAMKLGAYDFLPKPFAPDELRIIVRRGLEKRKLSLESAQLRQEKERIKEYFITLVSHELRSPLATVHQYCDTILGGFVGEVNQSQGEILKICRERVSDLLKLVDDWLSLSRIESGEIVAHPKPVNLASLLAHVAHKLQSKAAMNAVTIRVDSTNDLPSVLGNAEALELVFTNLISNSIKFNVEGGKIEISAHADGKYVIVDVTDTGIGISAENLPFIFDEFYRIKNGATRRIPGSGLGLSLVRKIVNAHSGRIQVVSEEGRGSTFKVMLPKTN